MHPRMQNNDFDILLRSVHYSVHIRDYVVIMNDFHLCTLDSAISV